MHGRRLMLKCQVCNGSGIYCYDEIHATWCEKCCLHEDGYWLVTTEDHGKDFIGKWLCKKCGCIRKI